MSRSYKKYPVYTDGVRRNTKNEKRRANRKVRRYNNKVYDLLLDATLYKRYYERYNIHDYRFYLPKSEAMKKYNRIRYYRGRDLKEYIDKFWSKYYRRK